MWKIEWEDAARKELRRLDNVAQQRIIDYLHKRISTKEDPRRFGDALTANKAGLWRYRVGDYRIVCNIEDKKLTVLVVRVEHRRNVYE